MPDYQKAKIYKLWSPEGDDIYIGSTTQLLCNRKAKHKSGGDGCKSSILFEKYNDVRIELLEYCPCNNKEELARKEGEYIRNNECINKKVAGRTRKEYQREYNEKNEEKIKERRREYREKNEEKIKERQSIRVICECGMNVNKDGIARHRRTIRHNSILGDLK